MHTSRLHKEIHKPTDARPEGMEILAFCPQGVKEQPHRAHYPIIPFTFTWKRPEPASHDRIGSSIIHESLTGPYATRYNCDTTELQNLTTGSALQHGLIGEIYGLVGSP